MADEIHSDTGDGADTSATGKGINQQSARQQANPHQRSDPQQNVTIQGMAPETTLQGINWKLNEHGQQIFQLNFLMDDIPVKVQDLRTSQKEADARQRETDDRLDRLEREVRTVITVKPGPPPVVEITSKPAESTPPTGDKISVRAMLYIIGGIVLFSLIMMGLVVWLAQHG